MEANRVYWQQRMNEREQQERQRVVVKYNYEDAGPNAHLLSNHSAAFLIPSAQNPIPQDDQNPIPQDEYVPKSSICPPFRENQTTEPHLQPGTNSLYPNAVREHVDDDSRYNTPANGQNNDIDDPPSVSAERKMLTNLESKLHVAKKDFSATSKYVHQATVSKGDKKKDNKSSDSNAKTRKYSKMQPKRIESSGEVLL